QITLAQATFPEPTVRSFATGRVLLEEAPGGPSACPSFRWSALPGCCSHSSTTQWALRFYQAARIGVGAGRSSFAQRMRQHRSAKLTRLVWVKHFPHSGRERKRLLKGNSQTDWLAIP